MEGFSFPGGTNFVLFLQVLLFALNAATTKKQKTPVVALLTVRTGFNSLRCLAFFLVCLVGVINLNGKYVGVSPLSNWVLQAFYSCSLT